VDGTEQQNHVQVEKHVHFAPTKKATYDPKMGRNADLRICHGHTMTLFQEVR